MSRTYSQDEVREIIRRAAETTASRERSQSEDSGLSIDDLRDLAISTGLDPQVMLDAARSLDRDVEETFEKRLLGVKISAAHAIRIEGPFTDHDWHALVADCRSTFKAKGKVHDHVGTREWSNGNLHVLVEPAGEDVIVRMRTHNGQAQQFMGIGIAIAVSIFVGLGSTFDSSSLTGDPLGNLMLLFGAVFAFSAFLYTRIRRWAQTRESQMDAMGRRIEQRRDRVGQRSSEVAQIEGEPAERIELPEADAHEDMESVRAKHRER